MPPHAEHHEHVVSPALAPWVERAVGYRLSGFRPGVHVGMPSGSLTLVIPLDAPLTVSDPPGDPSAYGSVLAGLSAAPTHVHHDGNQHGVQLALRPGAARAIFGCRAAELADGSFELADVLGADAERLRERLHETDSWGRRLELVEQLLLARLGDSRTGGGRDSVPRGEVAEAWRLIRRSRGSVAITDVARHLGWSMRHLQQQFSAEFGLAPKAVAKVSRFERSVRLVASGGTPLADVAVECGYADQGHLTRDWRALAGTSPARWRRQDALAKATRETDPAQRHTA
ncbi:MAG TPA: helix-turn-helix domain-containing protein [Intrasporangium sp.]|uniref:helix-turn-helix domain-containing protein n=1 Tax=Intrasporangium sp. TaxID=1925024 RepID=UPI002B463FA6|nr:helix-turn-helix domain-containing protein [Intrasporangium sp.]HKX66788.1 helix-turn-helix domain-containing protein [Intrasporangium sp.]